MIAALLATTIVVQPGQTLSGIAANAGESLASIEAANPQVPNPNLIYPGQVIQAGGAQMDGAPAPAPIPSQSDASNGTSTPVAAPAPAPDSQVANPGSFQGCVIQHESGGSAQVMNSSGHYGLYQFDYSTWVANGGSPADFGNASAAEQTSVFDQAYSSSGSAPWAGDGC
ncbi:MAG TPA: LysM peptidoglycan-binding domain-containing protein [Streptosporangiaceae bacterium]|nr:LysM peptidoglycan-binding domain-containing protein [Streptosporangiaceae bacterium]